jgi:chromosome partitioning protein
MTIGDVATDLPEFAAVKPTVVTVFNQKGGVGKTTTSVNIAVNLAALGRNVVLIDLDSQSNATTNVGVAPQQPTGAYHLVTGRAAFSECLKPTAFANLRLIPGSDELAWADIELAMQNDCQEALLRALRTLPKGIDAIVIDCPPAPGIVSVNALVVADMVVMPVMPSPHALDGLHKAWWNVNRVRTRFNKDLHTINILLTMTEEGGLTQRLTEDIIAEFGARVLPVLVPRDNTVIESAARDLPVSVHAAASPAAAAYLRLAELLLARIKRVRVQNEGEEGEEEGAVTRTAAAERLDLWKAEISDRHVGDHGFSGAPESAAAIPWTEAQGALEALAGPGLGWKFGAALLLLALGAVIGFAAGMVYTAVPGAALPL